MMMMMCVCGGANIAFGLFHTSYSNLFSLWLKWLQDVVLCGFDIHWAIQWPLLVPRGLKKKVIAKETTPITMNVITYNGFQWHLLYSL